MESDVSEVLSEFRQREFIAWYEDHLSSSKNLDCNDGRTTESSLPKHSSLEASSLLVHSPPSLGGNNSSLLVIKSKDNRASDDISTPQSEKRIVKKSKVLQESPKLVNSVTLEGKTMLEENSELQINIKHERTDSRGKLASTGTQSSIFSGSKWDPVGTPNLSQSLSLMGSLINSPLHVKTAGSSVIRKLNDERYENGWDERWSSGVNLLECDWSDTPALFAHINQSLIADCLPKSGLSRTLIDLAVLNHHDITLAPIVERIKRRVLHRPSQTPTQTVAAPLSALDWIKRSKMDSANHKFEPDDIFFLFGYGKNGIGSEIGRKCLRLNFDGEAKSRSLATQCGWMTDMEISGVLNNLRKVLVDYDGQYVMENCQETLSGADSIDVILFAADELVARRMANRLMVYLGPDLTVKEFPEARPLVLRIMGVSKPFHPPNSRSVVFDIKFVLKDSEWAWAIKDFYSRSLQQVHEIIRACMSSVPKRLEQGMIGVCDFLTAISTIDNVFCWDDLLARLAECAV